MKLVDANVLIYAVDSRAENHAAAKGWLDAALSGGHRETVLLPWISLLAFVRLVTHPAVYELPLTTDQALSVAEAWLGRPNVVTPEPDTAHARRMRTLLSATGRGGNLVNDAHLAAIALQYGATVVTFDRDFARFPELDWEAPGLGRS